jgi:hypothetical protein
VGLVGLPLARVLGPVAKVERASALLDVLLPLALVLALAARIVVPGVGALAFLLAVPPLALVLPAVGPSHHAAAVVLASLPLAHVETTLHRCTSHSSLSEVELEIGGKRDGETVRQAMCRFPLRDTCRCAIRLRIVVPVNDRSEVSIRLSARARASRDSQEWERTSAQM